MKLNKLNSFAMAAEFCSNRLDGLTQLFHLHQSFMLTLCILSLVFAVVAAFGNLLVIPALLKASSIPPNLKRLLLSLAFSDLVVGMFVQPMFGIIIAVMLKTASSGNYDFELFCPTILTVCYFFMLLLACASFLSIIGVALDRLLAISLHLRYQELVTTNRIYISLVAIWMISVVAAFVFISLPKDNNLVQAIVDFSGLLLATVSYIHIYKIVRYHRNQIQSWQLQLQTSQGRERLRQSKSAYNTLFAYGVFLGCYLPVLLSVILSKTKGNRRIPSIVMVHNFTEFLVLLNSSLNPLIYFWRFSEIRGIVKRNIKEIL